MKQLEFSEDWAESNNPTRPNAITSYHKRYADDKGVKYFITCDVYHWGNITGNKDFDFNVYEFDAQFTQGGERCLNVSTVQWFTDPHEKHKPYPTIQEVENVFERMRLAYGGEYYELY